MNIFEEAIIYSTVMHTGATRKNCNTPYILHPIEVAQIISTLTDDLEVMTAGVLHDVVEDTDGTLSEIRKRFGVRVANLVDSETEDKYDDLPKNETWRRRKEETLFKLKNADDIGVKIMWLADKLSNIRSLSQTYSEKGDDVWNSFNQKNPDEHLWYYKTIAEYLEMDLNRTGAFKEYIKHLNFIWPGTFETEKTRYKKYREYSIDGCEVVGRGAKSIVYKYDSELIIKVYNENNTYKEVERENSIARKAFIAGIPTAISFGIVKVGEKYGSMFELLNSKSMSEYIALDTSRTKMYADMMADLAKKIHSIPGDEINLNSYMPEVQDWIDSGLGYCDTELASRMSKLIDALPKSKTVIHGDLHTGNIMIQNGEPVIIDMDRLSVAHPIVDLCGVYMTYVAFGELDHSFSENFLGFSYAVQLDFYNNFIKSYLGTDEESRISDVNNKIALLCYARLIRRVYKKGVNLSEDKIAQRDYYLAKVRDLIEKVDELDF